jgi:soluble lytic murein transglycosylase-like protein
LVFAVRPYGAPPKVRDGAPPQQQKIAARPTPKPPRATEEKIARQAASHVGKHKDPNPSAAEIRKILIETADRLGIPREILMAVAFKESTWRHYEKDGRVLRGRWSPSDVGIMQISEIAHPAAFPRAATDMRYNIEYGARYLKYQFERYGNWNDAAAAYNFVSARRNRKGRLLNQGYVDKVDKLTRFFQAAPESLPAF